MGYYKLSDSDSAEIKKYTSRVGTLITLLNYLDYHIQIFIEAILDLESDKSTTQPIIALTRSFDFSRRINFLKSLIKSKHNKELADYTKLQEEIVKCSEVRNHIAHSQIYFWDDPHGTHMMVSNMKKSELPPEKAYDQLTVEELDSYIKKFQDISKKFDLFTYKLGYFQGHRV
ncbi:hypothetical protein A2867_01990 [Candidatus Daviesbacteria bacterium RIFCSPHIGHO2_01_FULL_40_11]|uniref:Cthe-2314-like HEPN domain-containing protein n=1 Tax=Candidatus Daviesbacteria bacterium RIFCSPHIGHO2_01_FULL_40_11 TaxID=1797762 RepID=A0A1F5JLT1_9BACT|nr:MAG: hypothetical protein A2867_01990 [Candidatus Daviesbacteria bacterium RIFCSPHIGHO2_01_FULL_40_11]